MHIPLETGSQGVAGSRLCLVQASIQALVDLMVCIDLGRDLCLLDCRSRPGGVRGQIGRRSTQESRSDPQDGAFFEGKHVPLFSKVSGSPPKRGGLEWLEFWSD